MRALAGSSKNKRIDVGSLIPFRKDDRNDLERKIDEVL